MLGNFPWIPTKPRHRETLGKTDIFGSLFGIGKTRENWIFGMSISVFHFLGS